MQTGRVDVRRNTRRGSYTALAVFAIGAVVAAPAVAGAQVSVDEAEMFLDPSMGGRHTGSFTVTNEGGGVAQVTIYLQDWDRQENGEHRFLPTGTLPQSCAKYLQVFPLALRLPPGSRQMVRLALQGADSLAGACWSIAFVETSASATGTSRHVTYVTRLGVKIYVVPEGLTKEGAVEDMVLEPGDSSGRRLAVTFHATGGRPLWVRGSVEYRRPDNTVAAVDSVPEFPVQPGARRRVSVPVHKLAPGKYLTLALLDYGGSEIAAGQISLEVP